MVDALWPNSPKEPQTGPSAPVQACAGINQRTLPPTGPAHPARAKPPFPAALAPARGRCKKRKLMKVMLGALFAKPKLHFAPGADQRGQDRGEAGGQAERRRHGQCSDGGDGTGQPNGFGRCRKIGSRRDAEPQSSLPLAPGTLDRLQQGALGRGAVCAGIAGNLHVTHDHPATINRRAQRFKRHGRALPLHERHGPSFKLLPAQR